MSRGPLGTARPLSLAALDAAISETIGRPVRADRLARDDRVYRWIVRRVIAEGSLRFRCTYAEAAAGAGYAVPRLNCRANRKEARQLRVSTVYRALCSLRSAGLLRFGGLKRENGQWRCLSIALSPAAYGPYAPFGRSRRRPTRCPGPRISFLRRNGTSPPVAKAKNRHSERGRTRARAREPDEEATRSESAFHRAAFAAVQPEAEAPGPRPWPHEVFDLRVDERVVRLCELFEAEFGIPARFVYAKHAEPLTRILDRFDRFTGEGDDRWGWLADGRRRRPGAGLRHAEQLVRRWGRLARLGNQRAAKVRSLAYFLPKLDQESKKRRRTWRARYGLETWGPIEEDPN
jgi:hypothetical protein